MGMITILDEETTKNPITLMGEMAGHTTKADTTDPIKNYKRGIDCLESMHGRCLEFPTILIKMEGYSSRVIREWYTHIGCLPTRLQESTRYVNLKDFEYVTPASIENNEEIVRQRYIKCMNEITDTYEFLTNHGVPREDAALVLPLATNTTIVDKRNLRNLVDMCHQRLCYRAYWEYRELMNDLLTALSEYSEEWAYLVKTEMKPKCEFLGRCPEKRSCGYYANKKQS